MRSAVSQIAMAIAVAVSQLCAGEARTRDLNSGADKILFFSGLDLWRHGAFTYAGAAWSPQGLDREGFVFKLAGGTGTYRYRSDALASDITGRVLSFSLLPGWRFQRDRFTLTVFAGFDFQRHDLNPIDTTSRLLGSYSGVRATIETWYEPNAMMMIAGDLSATSIGPSYSGRGAVGWRLLDRLYFGPEIAGFAFDDSYRQFRIGAHVTALKLGASEWSAALGWSRDSDNRDGLYGRLGLLMRSGLSW